ncbi:MAG: hypothetical protein KatS3mg085_701 [Candidatus Dojkabacteria bacterium]|nr:MAG: hypothetical protein KatS3mg085_701 [Candidatus Dojkabacteria bacterium]
MTQKINAVNDKKVIEYLTQFGLNSKEINVYLTLLRIGPSSVMKIARETGIKRSTTHNVVEDLVAKGLASQTYYGARRMVVAEPPEKLSVIIDSKKWEIQKLEESIDEVVSRINEVVPTKDKMNDVDVKYFDGDNGFKDVVQRALKSGSKEILIISNVSEFFKVYNKDYDDRIFIPKRIRKGISVRNLVLDDPMLNKLTKNDKEQLRETRILPTTKKFLTTTYIYENEISIMVSHQPYKAVVVNNKFIADTFKIMFDMLWEISKKVGI